MRGGVPRYVAQETSQFDAEIAEKGHLWMETSQFLEDAVGVLSWKDFDSTRNNADNTRPLKNATFFCQARKAKILTGGIHYVFRG